MSKTTIQSAMADGLLSRALHLRSVREDAREADFVCSTDAVDSYGEILEQDWNLKRFLANPVVLWAHNRYELPIGSAKDVGVIDGELRATIVFASEKANPQAEMVWQSVIERTLRAVSVGFRPGDFRVETRNGVEVGVCSACELYEISVVPVPSNPETLARMRAAVAEARTRAAASPNQIPPADERGGASGKCREETHMDEKEKAALEAKISQREAEVHAREADVRTLEKQLAEERVKSSTLESQTTRLAEERDAQKARADALEASAQKAAADAQAKALDVELDALVGVKISPAEKTDFAELARTNRSLFERMVAQRSDMKLLGAPVTNQAPASTSAPVATDLATEVTRQMGDA